MIRDAESAKAVIFAPKGNNLVRNEPSCDDLSFQFIAKMDQDYLVVGNHVDNATREKIVQGHYVDFSKLLPKDKVMIEDEDWMELVVQNGKAYWTPAASESVSINNFAKWEQAFRVYANIYTNQYPQKSGELIQYNHIIHSISLSYVWENVYAYDKEFRLHISRHPERSWAVILQQAWSMKLRDRINRSDMNVGGGGASSHMPEHTGQNRKSGDYCKQFNKGKCNLGSGCRYEHRCSYCYKFAHGVVVCRKLIYDREKGGKKSGNNGLNVKKDNEKSSN